MRWTRTLIPTLKEVPSDAELKSHRLMIRSGMIKKLSPGVYVQLPLGWRVLKKVEVAGAQVPAELLRSRSAGVKDSAGN